MIICNCNNISESEIKEAIVDGFDSYDILTKHLDLQMCCGICKNEIEEMLDLKNKKILKITP